MRILFNKSEKDMICLFNTNKINSSRVLIWKFPFTIFAKFESKQVAIILPKRFIKVKGGKLSLTSLFQVKFPRGIYLILDKGITLTEK